MEQLELMPDLSKCIETVAKKEHQKIVNLLLEGKGNQGVEERAEILRKFLETADFKRLRRESEMHLIRGKKIKFIIGLEEGKLYYNMQVI